MWQIKYYQKENGEKPAYDFIMSLPEKVKEKALANIKLLSQHGLSLKKPYVKPITRPNFQGLWKLHARFGTDHIRIFYFATEPDTFVLLSAFQKKTPTTPTRELEKAMRHKLDYLNQLKNSKK